MISAFGGGLSAVATPDALLGVAALADLMDDRPVPTLFENMLRLHAEARRIREAPGYEPGQWVTPREETTVKGYGEPHLVIKSRESEAYLISIVCDQVHARWVENWQLEPWDQAKHQIEIE